MFQRWLFALTTGAVGGSGSDPSSSMYGQVSTMASFLKDMGISRESLTRVQAVAVSNDLAKAPAVTDLGLVKRTLFRDLTRLCLFFGRHSTESLLLPVLFAFLNDDRDWQLKSEFAQHVVGLCAYVGQSSMRKLVIPPLEDGVHAPQDSVAYASLRALSLLVELGLLHCADVIEVCAKYVSLTCHPSQWVRDGALRVRATDSWIDCQTD